MKFSRFLVSILVVFLLMFLLFVPKVKANPLPLKAWSGSSVSVTNGVDAVSSLIVSANSGDPQGQLNPVNAFTGSYRGPAFVTFLQAFTDTATAKIQCYVATNFSTLAPTNSQTWSVAPGATNIPTTVSGTNNFGSATNVVAVIRHTSTDTYERNRIWGCFGTNVIFLYPLVNTTVSGDIVYLMQPTAFFNATTNGVTGGLVSGRGVTTIGPVAGAPGIVNGSGTTPATMNQGAPFLMDLINGGQIYTNQLNAAGGYLP